MAHQLLPHPLTPSDAVRQLEVEVERRGARLGLTYRLTGDLARLAIPSPASPERADELWKHTCFEAFVRPQAGSEYLELNLAPSGQWAGYEFSRYREGMRASGIGAPSIRVARSDEALVLRTEVDPSPALADAAWSVALSAIIEETSGRKSYWALAHPPGRPDFHAPAGFVLDIPPPP
ncbi:MAG TPA: DOMON-like domain-containing protein [Caulobacteraceae bacterium]|nr:DOMON-like domain-containing protein [Caulobacteraceae bacterium]